MLVVVLVLGLFPEGFHLRARDFGESSSLLAGEAFHFVEAAGKFGAGLFHGDFWIDAKEAREIDGDEEDVANFRFDARGRFLFIEGVAEFGGFFGELVEDAVYIVPIEADARGFASELKAFEKRGKSARDAVEDGDGFFILVLGIRTRRRGNVKTRTLRTQGCGTCGFLVAAFFLLDDFPVAKDFRGIFSSLFAEDVRVAANHFFVNFADDVVDGETAFFTGDLRVEEDLEEEIAKFLGEFDVVGGIERVEDFVGFFDQIGAKSGVSLLAVPRATAGGAETSHDGNEFGESGAGVGDARCGLITFAFRGTFRKFAGRFTGHASA